MHTTTCTDSNVQHEIRPAGIGRIVRNLWFRYVATIRRRATERTLAGLCDRTLRDIGLHRSEIASISRHLTSEPRSGRR